MGLLDYNEKLAKDIEVIRDKVKRGMLPLVARNPELDRAASEYALAQAEHYHTEQAKGKNPPIPFRDSTALHKCADLIMYEELKWSHPDKMSIVEYPIMSDRNEQSYFEKYTAHSDLQYGDRRFTGRRKSHFTDDKGAPQVRNSRIVDPFDPTIERVIENIDLYDALENAGLSDRQRQAIDLVYFENMTQEQAAEVMGVSQPAVKKHIDISLRNLREYLTM